MRKVSIIAAMAVLMFATTSCDFSSTSKVTKKSDSTELVVDSISIAMDSVIADSAK